MRQLQMLIKDNKLIRKESKGQEEELKDDMDLTIILFIFKNFNNENALTKRIYII